MSSLRQVEAMLGRESMGVVHGLPGVPVASPSSVDEAREIVQCLTKDRVKFALLGRGSKLGWAALVQKPTLAISTAKLSGVVEFEPGDGVMTALAGTTLAELEGIVRPHGLRITPAVPRADNATLGGVIAAGQSGTDRLLHGAMRLHLLGTRLLQLNGQSTRSGGQLVKNVSGYDIHRLLAGSFGSLGLITQASLRLMTCPEDRWLCTSQSATPAPLVQLATQLLESGIRSEALIIEGAGDAWQLHLSLVGRRGHVEAERKLVAALLPASDSLGGEAAHTRLEALRESEPDWHAGDVVQVALKRSRLSHGLETVMDSGFVGKQSQYRIHPGLATIQVRLQSALSAENLRQLRTSLQALSAQVSLKRPTPLTEEFLPRVVDPVRARLVARLRQTYDPQNLLCTRPPLEPIQ